MLVYLLQSISNDSLAGIGSDMSTLLTALDCRRNVFRSSTPSRSTLGSSFADTAMQRTLAPPRSQLPELLSSDWQSTLDQPPSVQQHSLSSELPRVSSTTVRLQIWRGTLQAPCIQEATFRPRKINNAARGRLGPVQPTLAWLRATLGFVVTCHRTRHFGMTLRCTSAEDNLF